MINWITKLREQHAQANMTDMGREVLELLEDKNAEWALDIYTLTHKGTKTALWISNGISYFHLYRIGDWTPGDESKKWFSAADKFVLWRRVQVLIDDLKRSPEREALARLRLARVKEGT